MFIQIKKKSVHYMNYYKMSILSDSFNKYLMRKSLYKFYIDEREKSNTGQNV